MLTKGTYRHCPFAWRCRRKRGGKIGRVRKTVYATRHAVGGARSFLFQVLRGDRWWGGGRRERKFRIGTLRTSSAPCSGLTAIVDAGLPRSFGGYRFPMRTPVNSYSNNNNNNRGSAASVTLVEVVKSLISPRRTLLRAETEKTGATAG